MSGHVSVVAFEGELNSIVKEYLDFSGFDRSKATFEDECNEKKKPVSKQVHTSLGNDKLILVQVCLNVNMKKHNRANTAMTKMTK